LEGGVSAVSQVFQLRRREPPSHRLECPRQGAREGGRQSFFCLLLRRAMARRIIVRS